MSGKYTTEQLAWLQKARDFARRVPLSEVMDSDSKNVFRRDLFEAACKEGLGSLPFPSTYGGSGGDYVSFALVNEEFGRLCTPIMSSLGVHVLCQEPIYRFGSEEQKQKYLPKAATGEYLGAFGLTEPNAGSDTAAIETTARLEGDHYILNGTKTFITSGASADFYIVMRQAAWRGRRQKGQYHCLCCRARF
ncbi:MAG: acyl-CoA dehydrogenase family protein [Candidatus Obscuribacter sp.]|nr:acyl-CoA dehydrogenase family protein [Candidatus Obscuribacter sp.]